MSCLQLSATGALSSAFFEHELYHSSQYTILGDWFIPGWLVGGFYGMISRAIGGCGNLLEAGCHSVERGGGCS